eukprot:387316-Amorphochlora_amoeboformis.AAC.2
MATYTYPWFIQSSILNVEKSFIGQKMVDFTRSHSDIPIFIVAMYLFVIFVAPGWLVKEGRKMRKRFAFWNLLLAIFSFIGASRVVPVLYNACMAKGFKFTVCEDPQNWYLDGAPGLWVFLFIYSKIPELMDTVFLVLKNPKAKIRFLHWFHHLTVLLYCWHAYHHKIAPGIWFASMNFCVHAVMYTYYMFMVLGMKWVVQPFAQFITIIQVDIPISPFSISFYDVTSQLGMVVTATSAYHHMSGGDEKCFVNGPNYRMGLAMYGSYFMLFTKLFIDKYKPKKTKANGSVKTSKNGFDAPCTVTDSAGLFHNRVA